MRVLPKAKSRPTLCNKVDHSNRCSNHNLGSSSWRKIIVVISDFPINFCFTFFSLFLYSVLKVLVATVSLIPRLPISPFDVTNPRFGSGGSPLVGSNGLEPSTSRLSGVRSNHLSYAPVLFNLFYNCWLNSSGTPTAVRCFYSPCS